MKARTYPPQIRDFAALAYDLEAGYTVRRNRSRRLVVALDANVLWFMLDSSTRENEQVQGFVARMFGVNQVAGLVRRTLNAQFRSKEGFLITASHKYEADIAFVSSLKIDYERMRRDLDAAFSRVIAKSKASSSLSDDQLLNVVDLLQDEFEDSFDLLMDVQLGRPNQKDHFDQELKTIHCYDSLALPPELLRTLDKIAFLLREGDARPSFSVAQDIRALRDLALYNARRNSDHLVLLTFDQKLINVVRLMKYFREPFAQYLTIENCQTHWLWNIGNALGLDEVQPQLLEELIDDFRRKSSSILAPEFENGEKPFILFNKSVLTTMCKKADREKLREVGAEAKLELLSSVDELLRDVDSHAKYEPQAEDLVASAVGAFFQELKRLIPAVNLASAEADSSRQTLFRGLKEMGLSREQLVASLDKSIGEHAARSFAILGASSVLAPKTIQALQLVIDSSSNAPGAHKFIHRLPLPIQLDTPLRNDVLELVSQTAAPLTARYDKLLQIKDWRGEVADLTVAYLYASCGLAPDSERICRQILSSLHLRGKLNVYYFEAVLLLSSILRIHKTSMRKLVEAGRLLADLSGIDWKCIGVAFPELRLESEQLAGTVNQFLIINSEFANFDFSGSAAHRSDIDGLRSRLYSHRMKVFTTTGIDPILHRKLLANVQVNTMLLLEFTQSRSDEDYSDPSIEYRDVLAAALFRIRDESQRLSFFEEIVSIFSLLRNGNVLDIQFEEEIAMSTRLSNRLGWVLQRRERLNDFEYRICEFAKEEMRKIGYG